MGKIFQKPPLKPSFPTFLREISNHRTVKQKTPSLVNDHLDYSKGVITCHSFRAGLVSILGAAGFKDSDLKTLGRWSSRAYEIYCKLPRTKRAEMSRAMGDLKI